MQFEDTYKYVGEIGPYQWRMFVLVYVIIVFCTESIQIVFIGGSMDHWCRVEPLVNLSVDAQKKVAIPTLFDDNGTGDSEMTYSSCHMFDLNYSAYSAAELMNWNRSQMFDYSTPVVDCQRWNYDRSEYTSTIVSRFDLVCGWEFLNELIIVAYMIGSTAGSLMSGMLSDRIGRKPTLLLCTSFKIIACLASIFAVNYTVFFVARILLGFSIVATFLTLFVFTMELVDQQYRAKMGTLILIAWASGYMVHAAIAYFLRDEFTYQIASMAPNLAFPFIIAVFVPESPRWLFTNKKFDKLQKLFEQIASVNGRTLPPDLDFKKITKNENVDSKGCSALCESSILRFRTIMVDFIWWCNSLTYFGMTLNTGALHGSVYINTFLSGAIEIPAQTISYKLMNSKRFGRRWGIALSFTAAALTCFVRIPLTMLEFNSATTVFAILGKGFSAMSFPIVFVMAAEQFPTEVRNAGMGTGTMSEGLAGMIAAFTGFAMMRLWEPLPPLIFGICSLLASVAVLLLPETLGKPLFDTVHQLQMEARKKRKDLDEKVGRNEADNSDHARL